MKFYHHDIEIELDDTWWAEAGMNSFTPTAKTYRVDINILERGLADSMVILSVHGDEYPPKTNVFFYRSQLCPNHR